MSLVVKFLCHDNIEVSSTVFSCLSRFTMSLGKHVSGKKSGAAAAGDWAAFDPEKYLPTILSCLYRQMQYPQGYPFGDPNEAENVNIFELGDGVGAEEEENDEEVRDATGARSEARLLVAPLR